MVSIDIYFALLIALAVIGGFLIGRLSLLRGLQERVVEAERRVKEDAEAQKEGLCTRLHDEMGKMRESNVHSAQVYQEMINTIDETLGTSRVSNHKQLETPVERQLQLVFQREEEQTPKAENKVEPKEKAADRNGDSDTPTEEQEVPEEEEKMRASLS